MSTFTDREAYLLRSSLREHAALLRKESRSRRYTGPQWADIRRELRETREECLRLARDPRLDA